MKAYDVVWRIYLVAGLVLALGNQLIPPENIANSYLFLSVAVTGPIAILIGLTRRTQRWPWMLVLVGVCLMVAGDVLWIWYDDVAGVDPFPSLADALYLAGYPVIAFGLLRMLGARRRGSERAGLIDATIVATGCGVLAWIFLIAPYVRDTELTIAERAVSSAYPLMSILLVAVVTRLGFSHKTLRVGDLLFGLGLVALLIADTYLGVIELTVGYDYHPVAEFLWLAMYVLVGAAALTPEASDGSDTSATHASDHVTAPAESLPRMRLPLLLIASLMAPGVLAWHAVRGHSVDLFVIAAGSALLFLLVIARVFGLVREVQAKAAQVTKLAAADPLTGLANRRHWDREIDRLLAQSDRSQEPLCVAMIDLDHFKRFNDSYGHYSGDTLLRDCAGAWEALLRSCDVIARIGGEEFALALPGCGLDRAEEVVARLRQVMPSDETFSSGIARWNGTETAQDLLIRADMALYTAKAIGRDCTVRAEAVAPDVKVDADTR